MMEFCGASRGWGGAGTWVAVAGDEMVRNARMSLKNHDTSIPYKPPINCCVLRVGSAVCTHRQVTSPNTSIPAAPFLAANTACSK